MVDTKCILQAVVVSRYKGGIDTSRFHLETLQSVYNELSVNFYLFTLMMLCYLSSSCKGGKKKKLLSGGLGFLDEIFLFLNMSSRMY